MSKCVDKDNGKDLEFLFKDKYIMDVKRVDKSNDLLAIKTLDAELNKSSPISVDENGSITSINISNKGKYYTEEPPNIIIKPPGLPGGKPAKATAQMIKRNSNTWEIEKIVIDDNGSSYGYDAIADKDKIEIEKKNTAQKKIVYNETKPKYYLLEKKQSQCNNLTDKWHDWFTIPYYYLGNNNGRKKVDENNKTRNIFNCYKQCEDKYVVNNDNVCESIETLEGGKYRNYISYDPLAIICILGSYKNSDYTNDDDVIKKSDFLGNYYYTIENIKTGNDEEINQDVQSKILNTLAIYKDANNNNKDIETHPVKIIKTAIDFAYSEITKYIKEIIKEAEQNDLKIKTIIKNNVNDFYQLFDKRDELYISYLNKLADNTHFKRVLYAKSIAHQNPPVDIVVTGDNITAKYLKYLFKYCKFLYFNQKNMFAIRLLNYGIYEDNYIDTKNVIINPDDEDANNNMFTENPTIINYNPVTVKIDTKHKNLFDDYSNVYELYKSFILTYPVILLLSLILFIIIIFLYYANAIYWFISFLNFLYIFVIGILYGFIVVIACNDYIIKLIVLIISSIYQGFNFIYSRIMGIFNAPIIGSIIKFVLFLVLIGFLMNNNLDFIYGILMYIINTIVYIIFGIISIVFYIIYECIKLNPSILFPTLIVMSIMYAYYKIWFNFDINTLHKEAKKNAKIINEHSNSTTIFKSGVLKSGVGSTISMARLELYNYSYFKDLYDKAYDNYVEKIKEIEKYNKHLIEKPSGEAEETKEDEETKEAEIAKLANKNKDFNEKVADANIARSERREVEEELRKYNKDKDKDLKDANMELLKDILDKKKLNSEEKENIEQNKIEILRGKDDLRKKIRELKTSENKARANIKPFIDENVQKSINSAKKSVGSVFKAIPGVDKINKEGFMNMGVDKVKGLFDSVKIDPKALLKI